MINSADEYMKSQISKIYEIATEARKKGIDPSDSVEIVPAPDLAARVEGIVGPKGIAEYIRSLPHDKSRTQIAFMAAEAVIEGKFGDFGGKEKLIEQALRTGTAVLTEGVLVAPTEGISSVKIHQNQDGTEYLAVYYSGPIRSAGGTAAALSVLLADFLRRKIGLAEWRPTDTAVERYLEEMELYDARAARLQYKPSDDEFRHIVRNCPVCVTGDPTEEFEVGAYRNVPGIETNRIRGGMALVLCEGIAQKAAKVLGQAKKLGIDWSWLESVIKAPKAKEAKVTKIEPNPKYIEEVVAGRPVIAYPSRFGGFRLRYGRTRLSGFMAKGIHPATMIILDSFPAIGTQFKLERPGKGCVLTPCETIEPSVVRLKDGSVVRVESREHAEKLKDNVHTVLFIGDILVSYGDFLKSNSPLLPAGYNEEWWLEELRDAIELKQELKNIYSNIDPYKVDFDTALKISKETGIPLHPKFTFFWSNISNDEVKELIHWLSSGEWKSDLLNPLNPKELRVVYDPAKSILEKLLVPHRVERDQIIIEGENAKSIFISLGLQPGQPDKSLVNSLMKKIDDYTSKLQSDEEKRRSVDLVSILSGIKIRDKAGTWIGSRMGRPEKSRERHMKPAVHSLFPIGNAGGKTRNIIKAYKDAKARKLKYDVTVEIARMRCPFCGGLSFSRKCQRCGKQTKPERICSKCGKPSATEFHICSTVQSKPGKEIKSKTVFYDSRPINIVEIVEEAAAKTKILPEEVKCVNGLVSELKIPEPLEKGILRAVHDVSVFKDGTCRFDATNVPITYFYPREIGTPVSKLKELGYMKDAYGNELKSEDQLVELLPHDMIISERSLKYMARVARFVDDELVKIYGLPPYYNLKEDRDIIGHLVIELSPHTSCGIASRIIGTTKAHVCYAHPYLFAASRRDADGDENAIMLLMDGLLNFSKHYLPVTRGGQMDAPIVMMTHIDPSEVDDQVHALEVVQRFPSSFYEASWRFAHPSECKIEIVSDRLGKENEKYNLWFTHHTPDMNNGALTTQYVYLKSMKDKISAQLGLAKKIAAVDARDAAERLIMSHFLPDLYGNLRSFSTQQVRCVDCNMKYRRVPLSGKCTKCGGKLLLTVNRGGIEKYLKITKNLIDEYNLPNYLRQRIQLLERDIQSIFEDETSKQFNLAEFM
ncbi:MAG: DNA polymerase II large subunit [Candidatus Micrarchaeia archaeon]